ncbi:MAG: DUF4314 domain-containing protein [Eubacterium sp.]|nr:DUF4314 domain-containing protein [Eubacterium sp.]
MKLPSKKQIEKLRREYPIGTRLRLISMADEQAPPKGTIGEVSHIDDIGTIHMKWNNGSSLGLIVGKDKFEKV